MKAIVTYHSAGESEHIHLLREIDIEPLPPGSPLDIDGTVRDWIGGKWVLGTVERIDTDPGPVSAVEKREARPAKRDDWICRR